jgi:hypothetical protein
MATDFTTPSINCPSPELRTGQGLARVAVDDTAASLLVTFEEPIAGQNYLLDPRSYTLSGGQRLFPRILKAAADLSPEAAGRRVTLTLDGIGDFSIYTLTVTGPDIDPFFSSHKLRFRLACDERFDCRAAAPAAPVPAELPVTIDYLAKDYSSFRQALLDFISVRRPDWTERSEADIGIMLMELFAATADNLSYLQDRVANEAFLDTATQRRSVALHLSLIGYQIDEGASAYTWLHLSVRSVQTFSPVDRWKITNQPAAASEPVIVFEPPAAVRLDPRHNCICLYSWGNQNCCLPANALSAALAGSYEDLRPGDYLLFDNGKGNRDVVRLTAQPEVGQAGRITSPPSCCGAGPITSPAGPSDPITIVRWSAATPLTSDYCVSTSVVRGNMVVATHGETVTDVLRALTPEQVAALNAEIAARKPGEAPPRQRLELSFFPLAHLDPSTLQLVAPPGAPAASESTPAFTSRPPRNISQLRLQVDGIQGEWTERNSLLDSRGDARDFRVEIDDQGDGTVVFGDGTFGLRPPETAKVTATYRVGGGVAGNVAADTLTVLKPSAGWLISVTNPIAAVGGRDLESRDHARRVGPPGFHKPLVAVTAADYQEAAQQFTDASGNKPVQRANASFRWTGSWLTVTLSIDPRDKEGLPESLRTGLLQFLDGRRLAGYDLEILRAIYIPIELEIEFCIVPGFFPGDVQRALEQALGSGVLPGGRKGFFHPDNFTFGDSVFISRIYAAAMAVPGVDAVHIITLARQHSARAQSETATNLAQGFLAVGSDQIVQLDNDRNFPERGTLAVRQRGA